MKTSIKSFVPLCAIYLLASGFALAETIPAPGTLYILDGVCGVWDEYGNAVVEQGDLVAVSANSANGNFNMTCTLDQFPTDSGRTEVSSYDPDNPVKCNVNGNFTEDWHQVITRDGKTKLSCHYKN